MSRTRVGGHLNFMGNHFRCAASYIRSSNLKVFPPAGQANPHKESPSPPRNFPPNERPPIQQTKPPKPPRPAVCPARVYDCFKFQLAGICRVGLATSPAALQLLPCV